MGCAMSACGGLTTTKLANDDDDEESHYGERRENGKQGVVDIANKCELARVGDNNESEIDQTLQSLHCDPGTTSRAEAAPNVRAVGEMSGDQMTQRATWKRKREVRSAHTREEVEESRTLEARGRKRTNNLGALLLALIARGRRHSSTRIDVTRNSPRDSSFQIASQQPDMNCANTTAPMPRAESPAPERVQSGEHSPGFESHQAGGPLVGVSRSTPTIELDCDQQAASSGPADEASLFTSMHQLCYEIINRTLIGASRRNEPSAPPCPCPCLCLFVFGRPGSSRGELAYELVEHSPLIDFVAHLEEASPRRHRSATDCHDDCPLYHYLDVSSLIVANIDARIREYNRLVAQTLRSRRQQLASGETSSLESRASTSESQEEGQDEIEIISENVSESLRDRADEGRASLDDDEDDSHTTNSQSLRSDCPSPSTPKEPKSSNETDHDERALSDQFGLITLSTKQRSILQLKMVKYACCVTAKWVMHLLRREIGSLEERLARAAGDKHAPPRRVYLVNLVPNQLSLFKTCLYLQQSLPLGQLRMPHWAVKFERRTNIKLMMNRERATALQASSSQAAGRTGGHRHHSISLANPTGKRVLIQFKRLSQIRLPTILAAGTAPAMADTTQPKETATSHTGQPDETEKTIGSVAANLLANGPNEKLGPKYNDLFAQQFNSLNKLTRLRYNPTRNYNYSDEPHDHLMLLLLLQEPELMGASPSTTPTDGPAPRDSCHLKLSRLIDFEHRHEPPSPSGLSQVSVPSESGYHLAGWQSHEPISTGRLLAAPSPCPSSVASDGSSALSLVDFGGHHRRQQLSPPAAHTTSAGHFRFPPSHAGLQHQTGQHPLKWAVELELVDEQQTGGSVRWYHRPRGPTCLEAHAGQGHANQAETATDCCLHVYHNDERPVRSRSHASLLTASSSTTVPGTICQAENYYLVATRVAYATGKSQPVLEVKRLHRRVIRCSGSRSDTIKLRKLIGKACVCLTRDLDTWLRGAIFDQAQSPAHSSKHGHHSSRSIALVTYTLRVDVSKFAAGSREVLAEQRRQQVCVAQPEVPRLTVDRSHASSGSNGEQLEPPPSSPDPVVQLLRTQPKRSNLAKQRPASARPLSGNLGAQQQAARVVSPDGLSLQLPGGSGEDGGGDPSTRSSSPRQRHVQFKLGQAPLSAGAHAASAGDAQRRVWLRDNLFASANESRLLAAMDSLAGALRAIDNE